MALPSPPPAAAEPLLRIEGLTLTVPAPGGARVEVVRGLSAELGRGEMVGLVGESGCGKTLTALAVMRLLPPAARIAGGRAWLAAEGPDGAPEDLLGLPEGELRHRRGRRIGMVFQEPMTALNPVLTVGHQVAEAVGAHRPLSRRDGRREALALLERVALADAARRLDAYPHELSGGQRQRVMIAMALAGRPDLLLADEPTTALDVTVQARILDLLGRLRRELGLTVLLITHDLAVVAETCERVLVMYAGQVVEDAPAAALFRRPAHPYSQALLDASPRLGRPVPRGELPALPGRVPDPADLPAGCPFHPRCGRAMEVCRRRGPELYRVPGAGLVRARCFLHGGVGAGEGENAAAAPDGGRGSR